MRSLSRIFSSKEERRHIQLQFSPPHGQHRPLILLGSSQRPPLGPRIQGTPRLDRDRGNALEYDAEFVTKLDVHLKRGSMWVLMLTSVSLGDSWVRELWQQGRLRWRINYLETACPVWGLISACKSGADGVYRAGYFAMDEKRNSRCTFQTGVVSFKKILLA